MHANRFPITLLPQASGRMLGLRVRATPVRHQIEQALAQGHEVVLDFTGVEATQSFIDELIGAIVLRQGPAVLEHLVFKGCSDDVRAILEFVAADRADQFLQRAH